MKNQSKKFLKNNNKVILLPLHDNKRGNPVLFSAHFKDEILALPDGNGCKPVVVANEDYIHEVPFSSNSCLVDIDTMADYKKIIH